MGCFHRTGLRGVAAFLAAVALAACEPDDPQIRKELVELRTEAAAAKKELESLRSELAVVSKKAQQVDFLSTEQLAAGVERLREQMRKAVSDAFPGYELVSLSPGSVETPITTEHPYAVRMTFFLKGTDASVEQGPYFLVLRADRAGAWEIPTPEEIAARLGGGETEPATASPATPQGSVQNQGDTRMIDWGDERQSTAPPPPPNSGERGRPPQPRSGPEGGIPSTDPMPGAQETRSVEW